MTDPVIIGGVAVLIIGAMGGQIVNIIVALKTQGTVKTIEGHVNSATDRSVAEIASLRMQLAAAFVAAAEKKETASLLAQSVATRGPEPLGHSADPIPVEVVNTPLKVEQKK